MSKISDELLNLREYPETMYMDMYGNGHTSWDQLEHKRLHDVVFRAKYIRADLVLEACSDACERGYKIGKGELEDVRGMK